MEQRVIGDALAGRVHRAEAVDEDERRDECCEREHEPRERVGDERDTVRRGPAADLIGDGVRGGDAREERADGGRVAEDAEQAGGALGARDDAQQEAGDRGRERDEQRRDDELGRHRTAPVISSRSMVPCS
nr:hypothetical protein [Halarchaeum acidiphilum]